MSPKCPDCTLPQKELCRTDVKRDRRSMIQDQSQSRVNHHDRATDRISPWAINLKTDSIRMSSHTDHAADSGVLPLVTINVPGTNHLEECFRNIIATFSAGDNSCFDVISCALSCILVAERPLYILELTDAITISLEAQDKAAPTRGMQALDFLDWLRWREHPFQIDRDYRVTFKNEAMPAFLRKIPIRGVDNTHRTLAMVCLSKIRQSQNSGIMDYASHFWEHHCERAAQDDRVQDFHEEDVRSRVPYRMSSPQELWRNLSHQERHIRNIEQRTSLCVDNDWIYVERLHQSA